MHPAILVPPAQGGGRTWLSFQSPGHGILAAGPPPTVHIAATHPSSTSTPRPTAGPRACSQKWELSAQSLWVSQPPITAALQLIHCVPTYVDTCSVTVAIHASMCHPTHILKHRGMSGLWKGDVHGLAAAHIVVSLCIRWAWEIPASLWPQASPLANF